MTVIAPRRRTAPRQLRLVLAALAILTKVLIPPGFMAAPAKTNDLPFQLSLCTSEGPVTVAPGAALPSAHEGGKAPAGKAPHESPCAFSSHGVAAPAPTPFAAEAVTFAAYAAPAPQVPRFDLAPGRGLAAPPLPARGPPVRSI